MSGAPGGTLRGPCICGGAALRVYAWTPVHNAAGVVPHQKFVMLFIRFDNQGQICDEYSSYSIQHIAAFTFKEVRYRNAEQEKNPDSVQ
jgi:hypothetical protein